MGIHASKRSASEHNRRYNEPEISEVGVIIIGAEDGDVDTRDVVFRKRSSVNRNESQVLDKISIGRRAYDPLSYVLLFADRRIGRYQRMVMEYRTEGNPIVMDADGNEIGAKSSPQPMDSNREGRQPGKIEFPEEYENNDEEKYQ